MLEDSRGVERTLTYAYGRLIKDDADWGSNPNIVGPEWMTWDYDIDAREVTSAVGVDVGGTPATLWENQRNYNWLGELESEIQGVGSDPMQWDFEWGYGGELRRVDYPASLGVVKGVFTYKDDGRALAAEYSDSSVVADYQFAYAGLRLLSRTDSQSGIRMSTGFDGWGHLTKLEWEHDPGSGWATLDGQERAFDLASRVIARQRSIDSTGEVFEHDGYGRLEDWYQGVPSALSHTPGSAPSTWTKLESYDLNDVYARTSVTKQDYGQSSTTENYTSTSGAHFYDSVPDGQGGQRGRTNYHGFLSDDSDYRYRYDAWGRLNEVERKSDNTVIREFLYDAEGRRIRVTDESGISTRFVYWGSRLAAQFDEGQAPANLRTYGYAGGGDSEAFVVVEGAGVANGTYELARDFQGSTLALADRSSCSVVERYRYEAFGAVAIEDGSGTSLSESAYANDRFFLGRPLDPVTGLYDVRARWYDPRSGSFASPDPWGSIDSWNMYQYGFGAPLSWSDSSGLAASPDWAVVWTVVEVATRFTPLPFDDIAVGLARTGVAAWRGTAGARRAAAGLEGLFGPDGVTDGGGSAEPEADGVIRPELAVIPFGPTGGAAGAGAGSGPRDGEPGCYCPLPGELTPTAYALVMICESVGALVPTDDFAIDRRKAAKDRRRYWKREAEENPGEYSESDLDRMRNGKPPIGEDGHPMELHHADGTEGGRLVPMTRTEHRLGENYRRNHPWLFE